MNAKSVFFENIHIAENILNVVKIREVLQPLKRRPIFTRIAEINPQGMIGTTLKLVDETVEIAVPLLLVFSVSCLEHYLAQVGPRIRDLALKIQHWEPKAGMRPTRDIHEIRIKRNIIMHSPERKIDRKAEEDAKKRGITGYRQGMPLKLDVEHVRKDLGKLRSFVDAIDRTI